MICVSSNPNHLQEVGQIAHVAKSGRVIIALNGALKDGTTLCSNDGHKIARVMEVIGPVSKPFASAIPLTNNISPHIGKRVFSLPDTHTHQKKRYEQRGYRK